MGWKYLTCNFEGANIIESWHMVEKEDVWPRGEYGFIRKFVRKRTVYVPMDVVTLPDGTFVMHPNVVDHLRDMGRLGNVNKILVMSNDEVDRVASGGGA